jgi:BMFP domain-containing protein YqiC
MKAFAMKNESIDRLARRLAESVPASLRSVRDDLEANFRSVLRNGLARLDLVTREEFEVQEAILARSRARYAELEERLSALEAALAAAAPAAGEAGAGKTRGKKTAKKAAKKTRKTSD